MLLLSGMGLGWPDGSARRYGTFCLRMFSVVAQMLPVLDLNYVVFFCVISIDTVFLHIAALVIFFPPAMLGFNECSPRKAVVGVHPCGARPRH